MLPFDTAAFLAVFVAYNEATWPAERVAYLAAALALVLAVRGGRYAGAGVAAVLATLWAWSGLVYHGIFFARINPLAPGFAALFVAQAGMLLWQGVARGNLAYGPPVRPARRAAGLLLVLAAMLIYPLLGGHAWPAVPSFGITPCPLTILTFGMLLLARSAPATLFAVPVIWSVIGGLAALLLGVPQDVMLPLAALVSIAFLVRGGRLRQAA